MSTVILDTITGKSTSTTITIGSTPVVSASANSMTIRGEGSAQTSIQQGLAKAWAAVDMPGTPAFKDSFNNGSMTDAATGRTNLSFVTNMGNTGYSNPSEEAAGQAYHCTLQSNTTTGYQLNIYTGSAYADSDFVTSVFGDLA